MKRKSELLLVGISFLSFISLGASNTLRGVAWPSIRGSFELPLDAVGLLLILEMTGYLLGSFYNGPMISKLGVGKLLMLSAIVRGLGLLASGLAPTWWLFVVWGLIVGLGGGVIDAGINTYFAANHSASLMNWLHATYGLGATLGPALVTAVLSLEWSWRWAYAIVGLLYALVVICFALTQGRWFLAGSPDAEANAPLRRASSGETLSIPLVWTSVAFFFIYTGVQSTGNQWPYSLFTEARLVDPKTAGFWASVYWGSLMVGRIAFSFISDRVQTAKLLRVLVFGMMCGAALLWSNVTDLLGFLGLALIGFAQAPVFALMVSVTPKRIGDEHAANTIGFQLAAASLGGAALPGLAGVLAQVWSLEIVGPFMLVASMALFLLHEALARVKT